MGVSQGGTILFDILNNLPRNIGGIFAIKTVYMYKYTVMTNKFINTPIYIFSGKNDNIYTIKLQNKCFDMENDLLFKIHLINNTKLLFVFSDLIIDGKSVHYFITELEKTYNTFLENKRPKIKKMNMKILKMYIKIRFRGKTEHRYYTSSPYPPT